MDYVFNAYSYDFNVIEVSFEGISVRRRLVVETLGQLLQSKQTNPSGRTMLDEPTELQILSGRENQALIRSFVEEVTYLGGASSVERYVSMQKARFNPQMGTDLPVYAKCSPAMTPHEDIAKIHRLLAEGKLLLCLALRRSCLGDSRVSFPISLPADGKSGGTLDTVDSVRRAAMGERQWKVLDPLAIGFELILCSQRSRGEH
jgi:hypothetical protein